MSFERVKGNLEALVRAWMDRTDYHAMYPCRVIGQNSDGTLALKPDTSKFPGIDRIPLRLGLPGVTVKVAPGSRVLLGFENGSPSRPVATLWEVSSVLELNLTTSAKVTISSPEVDLGAGVPVDAVVKGTTYRAAEDTALTLVASAMTAIASAIGSVANISAAGGAAAAAAGAAAAGLLAFKAGAPTYLSAITKTS